MRFLLPALRLTAPVVAQDIVPCASTVEKSICTDRPTRQFAMGANIGLNRNTPDLVTYVGISTRF